MNFDVLEPDVRIYHFTQTLKKGFLGLVGTPDSPIEQVREKIRGIFNTLQGSVTPLPFSYEELLAFVQQTFPGLELESQEMLSNDQYQTLSNSVFWPPWRILRGARCPSTTHLLPSSQSQTLASDKKKEWDALFDTVLKTQSFEMANLEESDRSDFLVRLANTENDLLGMALDRLQRGDPTAEYSLRCPFFTPIPGADLLMNAVATRQFSPPPALNHRWSQKEGYVNLHAGIDKPLLSDEILFHQVLLLAVARHCSLKPFAFTAFSLDPVFSEPAEYLPYSFRWIGPQTDLFQITDADWSLE